MTPTVTPDPWQILGIARGADPATVRAAYHRLAQRHHPDRGGDARRMAAVNRAYAALRNARSTSQASTAGAGRPPAASAQRPATRPPEEREHPNIWASHHGQWLILLAALGAVDAVATLGQQGVLFVVAGLLAVIVIADRRPAGVPFHPADDALAVLVGAVALLVRATRASAPSTRVSRRR